MVSPRRLKVYHLEKDNYLLFSLTLFLVQRRTAGMYSLLMNQNYLSTLDGKSNLPKLSFQLTRLSSSF